MKKFFTLVSVISFFCGGGADASRNGTLVGDHFHSYVGQVKKTGSICSGTLVAGDVVLTAAHCVSAQDPGQTSFAAYDEGLRQRVEVKAREIKVAGSTTPSDLALIKLQKSIVSYLPRLILNPVTLPLSGEVQFVGYGVTDNENEPRELRRAGSLRLEKLRELPGQAGSLVALALPGQTKSLPCKGDSGASVLLSGMGTPGVYGVIAAVSVERPTAFVSEQKKCKNGVAAWIVPLSVHAGWIQSTLAAFSYE